ncbi:cation diffusion facilitator family transporter [Ornithinimicrobium flavum]|uniref:cation diffusion facilitator family transporter n=1 Tax=Ornithinimicrobium flavum TaxID=1288636 RepID=UPI00106FA83D|nr:cation diffusion facilitator family transporter [Ornithinimicrobium flavum]
MSTSATPAPGSDRRSLTRFAWLAIATAIATITLKTAAWVVTGSVGLLSDAAESVVNLVAAVVALVTLRIAARPASKAYHYGHSKAEYFSAAIEGVMIFIAASVILVSSVERFINPQPLSDVGLGLVIAVVASVLNGTVAMVLLRAGRVHRSAVLTADGKHLLTDVWTSVGVVVGVGLVVLTGWDRLDPVVAFAVGVNIIITGWKLIADSAQGLMDVAWSKEDNARLTEVLRAHLSADVDVHGVRTRQSGHRRYAEMHVLVPGGWSVTRGHDVVEDIEQAVKEAFEGCEVTTHLEPREDPRAYDDYEVEIAVAAPEPDTEE